MDTMKKSKFPKSFDSESGLNTYGPAVRVVSKRNECRVWTQMKAHNRYQSRSLIGSFSFAFKWYYLLPFPLRRLLIKVIRVRKKTILFIPFYINDFSFYFIQKQFIFLVVLMVTVIINILFIIDTRNRLLQQEQEQQHQLRVDNSIGSYICMVVEFSLYVLTRFLFFIL